MASEEKKVSRKKRAVVVIEEPVVEMSSSLVNDVAIRTPAPEGASNESPTEIALDENDSLKSAEKVNDRKVTKKKFNKRKDVNRKEGKTTSEFQEIAIKTDVPEGFDNNISKTEKSLGDPRNDKEKRREKPVKKSGSSFRAQSDDAFVNIQDSKVTKEKIQVNAPMASSDIAIRTDPATKGNKISKTEPALSCQQFDSNKDGEKGLRLPDPSSLLDDKSATERVLDGGLSNRKRRPSKEKVNRKRSSHGRKKTMPSEGKAEKVRSDWETNLKPTKRKSKNSSFRAQSDDAIMKIQDSRLSKDKIQESAPIASSEIAIRADPTTKRNEISKTEPTLSYQQFDSNKLGEIGERALGLSSPVDDKSATVRILDSAKGSRKRRKSKENVDKKRSSHRKRKTKPLEEKGSNRGKELKLKKRKGKRSSFRAQPDDAIVKMQDSRLPKDKDQENNASPAVGNEIAIRTDPATKRNETSKSDLTLSFQQFDSNKAGEIGHRKPDSSSPLDAQSATERLLDNETDSRKQRKSRKKVGKKRSSHGRKKTMPSEAKAEKVRNDMEKNLKPKKRKGKSSSFRAHSDDAFVKMQGSRLPKDKEEEKLPVVSWNEVAIKSDPEAFCGCNIPKTENILSSQRFDSYEEGAVAQKTQCPLQSAQNLSATECSLSASFNVEKPESDKKRRSKPKADRKRSSVRKLSKKGSVEPTPEKGSKHRRRKSKQELPSKQRKPSNRKEKDVAKRRRKSKAQENPSPAASSEIAIRTDPATKGNEISKTELTLSSQQFDSNKACEVVQRKSDPSSPLDAQSATKRVLDNEKISRDQRQSKENVGEKRSSHGRKKTMPSEAKAEKVRNDMEKNLKPKKRKGKNSSFYVHSDDAIVKMQDSRLPKDKEENLPLVSWNEIAIKSDPAEGSGCNVSKTEQILSDQRFDSCEENSIVLRTQCPLRSAQNLSATECSLSASIKVSFNVQKTGSDKKRQSKRIADRKRSAVRKPSKKGNVEPTTPEKGSKHRRRQSKHELPSKQRKPSNCKGKDVAKRCRKSKAPKYRSYRQQFSPSPSEIAIRTEPNRESSIINQSKTECDIDDYNNEINVKIESAGA